MTLEETIRHCEEVAYENRREQNYFLEPRDKEGIFRGVDFEDLAQNACDMAEHYEQLADWLRELQARRRIDKLDHIIRKTAQYQMPEDLVQMRNEIKELEKYVEEVQNES